jgi:hypothetical protein
MPVSALPSCLVRYVTRQRAGWNVTIFLRYPTDTHPGSSRSCRSRNRYPWRIGRIGRRACTLVCPLRPRSRRDSDTPCTARSLRGNAGGSPSCSPSHSRTRRTNPPWCKQLSCRCDKSRRRHRRRRTALRCKRRPRSRNRPRKPRTGKPRSNACCPDNHRPESQPCIVRSCP